MASDHLTDGVGVFCVVYIVLDFSRRSYRVDGGRKEGFVPASCNAQTPTISLVGGHNDCFVAS